ncbi:MAG: helix-turn-helix domain-containing protein [Bacillota bacterium]|nr:helix-turn-helix domain-containing protein [Bacillota bacterium]
MFYNDYDIMTINELCDYLNIGQSMVYKLLNSGKLSAFRIGNRWKIPRKCVDEYVNESVKRK